MLRALEGFSAAGHLLPEQIWDAPDIPERELYLGKPSGSVMPLVWAHAEHINLLRSLRDGRVFDMPCQTFNRYCEQRVVSPFVVWRFNHKTRLMPAGKTLRIEFQAPALVHWSGDGWATVTDTLTTPRSFGMHVADLFPAGSELRFTFYWPEAERWEGRDFLVRVV